jgi:hypothetical protein
MYKNRQEPGVVVYDCNPSTVISILFRRQRGRIESPSLVLSKLVPISKRK